MAEPAPYGGLLIKTLEDEKQRESVLADQAVEVAVNGQSEVIRPEALHIRGVDNLSTDDIKAFIDYYLNYTVSEAVNEEGTLTTVYEPLPIDDQITFRTQWINDSSVNVTFKTHEDCFKALQLVSITASNPNIAQEPVVAVPADAWPPSAEYLAGIVQEREAKPYNPILAFKKHIDMASRLGIHKEEEEEEGGMEEDESSVVLYLRQSFQSDRKVKNASAFSRYYLLHGEPERRPFRKPRRDGRDRRDRDGRDRRDRDGRDRRQRHNHDEEQEDEEDLFAHKLRGDVPTHQAEEDEEDLFADKLKTRERSPTRDRSRSPSYDRQY